MLQNEQFQYFPQRLIMGEVTWLAWPQMTCMKKSQIYKMWILKPGASYFLKVASSWERLPAIDSVAKLRHFMTVRRFTYNAIGQWPDLTWKGYNVRLERGVSRAKLSSANCSGAIASNSSWGGALIPFGRRGLTLILILTRNRSIWLDGRNTVLPNL